MAIQARLKPKFPARVVASTGITITKSGGVYTFAWDVASLAEISSISASDRDNLLFPVYNEDTLAYRLVSLDTVLASISGGLDATLVSIAALTPVADQGIYFSDTDTAAAYSLTASGRALSGVTGAADKVAYFTGAGTASVADFTAYGRSVVAVASEAALKALVNLEIGTDVQAYHARLSDIAGITYAQGDVLYFNGTNIVKLAAGSLGQFLKSNGAGTNPSWGDGAASFGVDSFAALRALDTTTVTATAAVITSGATSGFFTFDSSDLSGTLVTRTVVSTVVDDVTNVITSAGHGMITGQVGFPTTSVNGVTSGTKYYVIRVDNDNYELATSYANAMAGVDFDLTGTTNFTFKRLLDPREGVYVIPTGFSVDGSSGAWIRQYGTEVSALYFDLAVDGTTDDREGIMAALEFAQETLIPLRFPGGTFGFNPGTADYTELYVYRLCVLKCAGIQNTIFKNLSASGKGMTFERHGSFGPTPGQLNTNYIDTGGFTLDMNGSTGRGLYVGAGFTNITDFEVKDQAGAEFAFTMQGCTLSKAERFSVFNCNKGMNIIDAGYLTISHARLEAITGRCLDMTGGISNIFNSLYFEWDETVNSKPEMIRILNSTDTHFNDARAEIPPGATLIGAGYIVIDGSNNTNFYGGRIYSYQETGGTPLFHLANSCAGFNVDGLYWHDEDLTAADKTANTFLTVDGVGHSQINLRNIVTNLEIAGCAGVNLGDLATSVSIENWRDPGVQCTHTLRANILFVKNCNSHINVESGTGHVLANCTGTLGGAALASAIQLKAATTSIIGCVELSTDAEAKAKTDTARAITPSNLAALASTVQTFAANDTYTKPASLAYVDVEVWGGGGSAGGVPATTGTEFAASSGGGGGGYSKKRIAPASIGATETVTIGAGGAAPTAGANNGNAGGTTSFGIHLQATGGAGGVAGSATTKGSSVGSAGGVGSGGDENLAGGSSTPSFVEAVVIVVPSNGGAAANGSGSALGSASGVGTAGKNYGGGGGGSSNQESQAAKSGAVGAGGFVRVTEHYV